MLAHQEIDNIALTIRAASVSMEGRFLDLGKRLESSVAILGTLAETFDRLSQQLQSENVQQARRISPTSRRDSRPWPMRKVGSVPASRV